MKDFAALFVSSLALFFTAFSFWWMNWRSGKLYVGEVVNFAAGKETHGSAHRCNVINTTLPLVIGNIGARPLVVEALRLVSTRDSDVGTLYAAAVDSHIGIPIEGEVASRDFLYFPFCLRPNDVIKANFVFHRATEEFSFTNRLYNLHLEAKVSRSRHWLKLKHIELDFRDRGTFSDLLLNASVQLYPYAPERRA